MLTRTGLNKFAGLMLWWVPMAAMANTPAHRFPLSMGQIADALASAGLVVNVSQVEFLSTVNAASEQARLQVVNTASRAGGNTVVKLRCLDNHECLPFYVMVHASTTMSSVPPDSGKTPVIEDTSFPRVVRGGDFATLILESADYRISVPVICLQNGARGQTIRVASRDHRRFFEGEVIGSGMLRGRL